MKHHSIGAKPSREVFLSTAFDKYFEEHGRPVVNSLGIVVIRCNWRKENGEIIREIIDAEFRK